ncbi:MAG: Gfo/Idh/MocA family oxidoreductase [Acidobacteriota bacterium]|nr:Gfo/Idh/MocA family oxidoreductase [Acidobacteriota bacterium]
MKKVAVVGFGFMGITHALNILKSGRLDLKAIVEKNPSMVARNLESGLGNIATGGIPADAVRNLPVYTSIDDCLDREDLDALHICVHTRLHYSMARKALERGKHVLLEKPLALDIKEGRELIALARNNGLVFMVAHVVRFMPAYALLKEWIDAGTYGPLEFLSLSRLTGIPAWGEWKSNPQVRASSGGALFDLVIHDIDYMQFAMGQPETIDGRVLPGCLSEHDYLSARWEFKNPGRTGIIEGGYIFHRRFPFDSRFIAKFSEASVFYGTHEPRTIRVAGDDRLDQVELGDPADGYMGEILYFADCLEKGRWPERCSPESSLRAIELCYAHIRKTKGEIS